MMKCFKHIRSDAYLSNVSLVLSRLCFIYALTKESGHGEDVRSVIESEGSLPGEQSRPETFSEF